MRFSYCCVELDGTDLKVYFGVSDKNLIVGPFISFEQADACCTALRPGDILISRCIPRGTHLPSSAFLIEITVPPITTPPVTVWQIKILPELIIYFTVFNRKIIQGLFEKSSQAAGYYNALKRAYKGHY